MEVVIGGGIRRFPARAIHLIRTDAPPAWVPPAPGNPRRAMRAAADDPRVRTLGPDDEGWYAAELPAGRFQLNAVSVWHFPVARAVPSLVFEVAGGDARVYAGSMRLTCRDREAPDAPGSRRYDCDPPEIRADELEAAAKWAGGAPSVRLARPLDALAAPGAALRSGALAWASGDGGQSVSALHKFPMRHGAAQDTAFEGSLYLAGSVSCGPLFAFCVAIVVPAVVMAGAIEAGVEHHGNRVRLACNERIAREVQSYDFDRRLRLKLGDRLAAAGRPLSEPTATNANGPWIRLDLQVMRVGVRGDDCLVVNPFKSGDRFRADLLVRAQALDGVTGEILYEEFLNNTDKLPMSDLLAGRSGVTLVGESAPCRPPKAFCPKAGADVLIHDLEPALEAFITHILQVFREPRPAESQPDTPPGRGQDPLRADPRVDPMRQDP